MKDYEVEKRKGGNLKMGQQRNLPSPQMGLALLQKQQTSVKCGVVRRGEFVLAVSASIDSL
jgi:hypothetical protein